MVYKVNKLSKIIHLNMGRGGRRAEGGPRGGHPYHLGCDVQQTVGFEILLDKKRLRVRLVSHDKAIWWRL